MSVKAGNAVDKFGLLILIRKKVWVIDEGVEMH